MYAERPASAEAAPPSWRLLLNERQARAPRFVRYPALTAHALIMAAVRGTPHMRPALRAQLLDQLGPAGRSAYAVLADRGVLFPDAIVPENDWEPRWSPRLPEAVAELDQDALVTRLGQMYHGHLPRRWMVIADDPRRWLHGLASGLAGAAPTLDRVWKSAQTRLDIEQARFDNLLASPAESRVLGNALSPHLTMTASELRVASTSEMFVRYPGELLIAPMAAPRDTRNALAGGRGSAVVGYGLAVANRTGHANGRTPGRLAALLGNSRAEALRRIERPTTMSRLAADLGCAPSTLSVHIGRLVQSGLVVRVQLGRQVWVARTAEGHMIVDLLAD